ncbi:MAG: hypothetical protein PF637_11855 [Spirochaetes bacterium]|jgi:hypothetical protein|nr:hypothetical protein [Spirochaetota bacterium]
MKFIIIGLIFGALLALTPFNLINNGERVVPKWFGSVSTIDSISTTGQTNNSSDLFLFPQLNSATLLYPNGTVYKSYQGDINTRYSFSGDRNYYIQFEKVGSQIAFMNSYGEKFWVSDTPQYPYLSHSAKLILLQVSDLHTLYLRDKNGSPVGVEKIEGRMCTTIAFSKEDSALIGFMSSEFYVVSSAGTVVLHGKTPEGTIVKGGALSDDGLYAAVHYGTVSEDACLIIPLGGESPSEDMSVVNLESVHRTRTGLAVSNSGSLYVIDGLYFNVFDRRGEKMFSDEIEPQTYGHAVVSLYEKGVVLSYRILNNRSALAVYGSDLTLLHSEIFDDTALTHEIVDGTTLIAAGTKNLAAYSLSQAEPR